MRGRWKQGRKEGGREGRRKWWREGGGFSGGNDGKVEVAEITRGGEIGEVVEVEVEVERR